MSESQDLENGAAVLLEVYEEKSKARKLGPISADDQADLLMHIDELETVRDAAAKGGEKTKIKALEAIWQVLAHHLHEPNFPNRPDTALFLLNKEKIYTGDRILLSATCRQAGRA